ncbi:MULTISPECIES: hypothetical protein [Halobacteriovorax]|uniref:Uncharacterized protein n=1 Tax=Halobacteriovorax vibrionivorans TaxID=2152716 RepID=A0ABY0IE36_9BACT|nr:MULTISPECIES: hypothetical protein [Halobacteriovorax]RZF20794.1 hypothetical protein DAY19_12470 [Halobacteriovorax vibrionivorans]TGD48178.1 hypothetical protein EP118_04570 [Halobacteriovorax sp. Y22]
MRNLILALMLFLSSNVLAANLQKFHDRFSFERDDQGKIVAVRDLSIRKKFRFQDYIDYVKNSILNEQALMAQSGLTGNYEAEVEGLFVTGNGFLGNDFQTQKNVKRVVRSMRAFEGINFQEIFANPKFKELMEEFQAKLKDAFYYIDPTIIAKPDNSTFFYRKNVTYKVVSWALNQARKRLSSVPALNTAFYVITEAEKLFRTRRHYHQNLMLHYLEFADASALGLTKEEVDLIYSSIYESRIDWIAFWESSSAKLNWPRYGTSNFYSQFRMATNRFRQYNSKYSEVGERLNYSFQEVTLDGERVIVNLFDGNHTFDRSPAVAYSYDRPGRVKRLRAVLTLAGLGLSFVPLPAIIKDNVDAFIKSYYKTQQITEGALVGYFEMNDNAFMKEELKSQYINPFSSSL